MRPAGASARRIEMRVFPPSIVIIFCVEASSSTSTTAAPARYSGRSDLHRLLARRADAPAAPPRPASPSPAPCPSPRSACSGPLAVCPVRDQQVKVRCLPPAWCLPALIVACPSSTGCTTSARLDISRHPRRGLQPITRQIRSPHTSPSLPHHASRCPAPAWHRWPETPHAPAPTPASPSIHALAHRQSVQPSTARNCKPPKSKVPDAQILPLACFRYSATGA